MTYSLDFVRDRAPGVLAAMGVEPSIRLSFRDADILTIAVVIHCLILRGIHRPARIFRYLNERRSPFRPAEVTQVLRDFEGADPNRHLWLQLPDGTFDPVLDGDYDFPF